MKVKVEVAGWLLSAAFCAGAFAVWRHRIYAPFPSRAAAVTVDALALDVVNPKQTEQVIQADPFRLDRVPADVPFEPGSRRTIAALPALVQRPSLILRGVVGGPPWEALVEGFPGRQGPIRVRAGDTLGQLVIRSVRKDTVIVVGMDSTWKLGLVRAW